MSCVREFALPRFGHEVQRGGPRAVKVEPKVYLEGAGVRATLDEGKEGIAFTHWTARLAGWLAPAGTATANGLGKERLA